MCISTAVRVNDVTHTHARTHITVVTRGLLRVVLINCLSQASVLMYMCHKIQKSNWTLTKSCWWENRWNVSSVAVINYRSRQRFRFRSTGFNTGGCGFSLQTHPEQHRRLMVLLLDEAFWLKQSHINFKIRPYKHTKYLVWGEKKSNIT